MENNPHTEFPLMTYELKQNNSTPHIFYFPKQLLKKLKELTFYNTSWRPNTKYLFWTHQPFLRADDENYGELRAYFELENLKTPAVAVTKLSQGYIRTPPYFQDDAERMELVITNIETYYFRLLLKRGVNNERRKKNKDNSSRRSTQKIRRKEPRSIEQLRDISDTPRYDEQNTIT
jgi:hypothetical protein